MDTLKGLNDAIKYIENNLCGEIDFDKVFRIAGCSEYHFRRVFSYFAGISLGEYIRNRRLTLAVTLLKEGDKKVIDVGLMLGYETHEAFARAFKSMHGVSPMQAKNLTQAKCEDVSFKVFLPLSFKLSISGGKEMKVRIVQKDEFFIVGYKKRITLQFRGVNNQMDSVISKLTPSKIAKLKQLSNTQPNGIISVSTNFADRTKEGTELDQYIGVATTVQIGVESGLVCKEFDQKESSQNESDQKESSQIEDGDEFDVLKISPCTYAVFESVGKFPDALQNTWAEIFSQWLPTSTYQLVSGAELLWHESPDLSQPNHRAEIWVPIKRKGE